MTTESDLKTTRRRRRGRLGRRSLATVAMSAVILVVLGTVAFAAVRPTGDAAKLYRASGRLSITNSRGGKALVGMKGMFPGDSVTGAVNIGNGSKKLRANFSLGLARLIETKALGGGHLSYRLVLVITRLSTTRRPQLVYSGPLRQMPLLQLGKFAPREKRTYRFTVSFPEAGPDLDNHFQGGAVSLQFSWFARQAR